MDNLDEYPKPHADWTDCPECGSRISSNMANKHICDSQQKRERQQWKEMQEDE